MNWNKYLKYLWWGTIIGITILSLMPPSSGREIPTNDKVGHFIAYGIFAFVSLSYGYRQFSFFKIILFTFSFGILMEYCQGFIPGREPSILDALANTVGILLGFLLFFYFIRKRA
jgi:VanZ family protein